MPKSIPAGLLVLLLLTGLASCHKKDEIPVPQCQNGGTPVEGSSYCECPEGYMLPECKQQARDPYVGKFTATFTDEGQDELHNPYTFIATKDPNSIWGIQVVGDKAPFNHPFYGEVSYTSFELPHAALSAPGTLIDGYFQLNNAQEGEYFVHFSVPPFDEYDGTIIRLY